MPESGKRGSQREIISKYIKMISENLHCIDADVHCFHLKSLSLPLRTRPSLRFHSLSLSGFHNITIYIYIYNTDK